MKKAIAIPVPSDRGRTLRAPAGREAARRTLARARAIVASLNAPRAVRVDVRRRVGPADPRVTAALGRYESATSPPIGKAPLITDA